MKVDRTDLKTGELDSIITLEEALNRLVPVYCIDREATAQTLRDGVPVRTTAFEYRKHQD